MTSVVITIFATDELIILLHYFAKTDRNIRVRMDTGQDSNKTQRLTSMYKLMENLTNKDVLGLPGIL